MSDMVTIPIEDMRSLLDLAEDNTLECLNQHEYNLGRTTAKNRATGEMYDAELALVRRLKAECLPGGGQ